MWIEFGVDNLVNLAAYKTVRLEKRDSEYVIVGERIPLATGWRRKPTVITDELYASPVENKMMLLMETIRQQLGAK